MRNVGVYRRLKVAAFVLAIGVFFFAPYTHAQTKKFPIPGIETPTPTPPLITPTSQIPGTGTAGAGERIANCDVCGYCNGGKAPSRWETCRSCMYPGAGNAAPIDNKTLIGVPTPDPYHYYTDLGCISTKPGEFAGQITTFFFSIVGGIAFLTFLYGTAVLATARSDPQQINHGRRIIMGSIIGLLFALFSIFIVKFLATGLGLPL